MKILIISDSHGQIANLKHVIGFGKKIGVKAVIHCGDWDDLPSFDTALSFGIPIYSVLGNADVNADLTDALRYECKKFDSHLLKLNIDGRRIGIVHRVNKNDKFENLDIVFSGHYHSKDSKMINFLKFVRPGALINGNNFAIYETANNEVEFIEDGE